MCTDLQLLDDPLQLVLGDGGGAGARAFCVQQLQPGGVCGIQVVAAGRLGARRRRAQQVLLSLVVRVAAQVDVFVSRPVNNRTLFMYLVLRTGLSGRVRGYRTFTLQASTIH